MRPAAAWAGFAMMCVGMFMAILDVQVVATAIPTIQRALDVAPDQISWIQTAYLIAEVIAIPLTGFLTRVLSMRWLFVGATTIFTLASAGCASAQTFEALIAWRVVQGLAGGALIPAVFSAVFLMFPERRQALATTLAGVVAVLAPTAGPIVGGWITSAYDWPWLFLINLIPGAVAATAAAWLLPREPVSWTEARTLDAVSLALMALALASLEIGLKTAPERGWASLPVGVLLALTLAAGAVFVWRTLRAPRPLVDLRAFRDRRFAVGCGLSFALGLGLFGSVYLMPVFLAAVRGYGPFQIGQVMLVTGAAQLVMAPVAVALERRLDARLLTAAGFTLFAAGLAMSAFQTTSTGFDDMFWPQVVRGAAIMFCLLPPTRMALGHLAQRQVPDASGLFNLMRNLGGAIGLALIDTVLYGRGPHHAQAIGASLQAGDAATARAVGIPEAMFAARGAGPLPPGVQAMLEPLVEKLALVRAANEAWAMLAILTVAALATLVLAPRTRVSSGSE